MMSEAQETLRAGELESLEQENLRLVKLYHASQLENAALHQQVSQLIRHVIKLEAKTLASHATPTPEA